MVRLIVQSSTKIHVGTGNHRMDACFALNPASKNTQPTRVEDCGTSHLLFQMYSCLRFDRAFSTEYSSNSLFTF